VDVTQDCLLIEGDNRQSEVCCRDLWELMCSFDGLLWWVRLECFLAIIKAPEVRVLWSLELRSVW